MQVDIKGRNASVTNEIREYATRRFEKVSNRVSELARLEVEVKHEKNPSITEPETVTATLYLKGAVLRARDTSHDVMHAIHLCSDDLMRQVDRYQAKRLKVRERIRRSAQARRGLTTDFQF